MPIVASLIDGTGGAYFPIIPYSIYFFIGTYLAQNEYVFRKEVVAVAAFGLLLYAVLLIFIGYMTRICRKIK